MTYYTREVQRIKKERNANQRQLDIIIRTRRYLYGHFASDIDLDTLARVQCTSKYHLLRLFKRYYGLTPRQYLIDRRIEKSKEFLRQGRKVSETCFAVGFESPGSFSTLFRRKTGQAPSVYRKKQLSRRKTGGVS